MNEHEPAPGPVQPVSEQQPAPEQLDQLPGQPMLGQPDLAAGLTAQAGRSGTEGMPPTGTGPATVAAARRKPRRRLQAALIALLAIIGLGGLGSGGFMLVHELTRAPTKTELAVASRAEVAQRWRELPAGKIFPSRVRYPSADAMVNETARLIGIAPQATCAAAAGPSAADVLRKQGCTAVLRATYTDSSGSMLTTIGVAVMPNVAAARAVVGDLAGTGKGIHPVGFIGSPSHGFRDAAVVYANVTGRGPYVIMDVSGFADGRRGSAVPLAFQNQFDFSDVIASSVLDRLTKQIPACAAEDVRC